MLQSICVLYIVVPVIYEKWLSTKFKNLCMILAIALIFNNCITANIYYNFMNQRYEKGYSTAVELVTRIHLEDNGEQKYIAMIGSITGFEESDLTNSETLRYMGALKDLPKSIVTSYKHIPLFLINYTDFELTYYKINEIEVPYAEKSKTAPSPANWQYRFPIVDEEELLRLQQTKEVSEMPCWPASESVKTIGDTIVIKLSEPADS